MNLNGVWRVDKMLSASCFESSFFSKGKRMFFLWKSCARRLFKHAASLFSFCKSEFSLANFFLWFTGGWKGVGRDEKYQFSSQVDFAHVWRTYHLSPVFFVEDRIDNVVICKGPGGVCFKLVGYTVFTVSNGAFFSTDLQGNPHPWFWTNDSRLFPSSWGKRGIVGNQLFCYSGSSVILWRIWLWVSFPWFWITQEC